VTKRRGSHRCDRFAVEYLKDLNATHAAIRAGYSAKTAASQGHRLLRSPAVLDAIGQAQAKLFKKTEVSVENVKRELEKIAFSDMGRFFDEHGHWHTLPINAVPEEAHRAVSQLKVEESFESDRGDKQRIGRPYEITLSDKCAAIELLLASADPEPRQPITMEFIRDVVNDAFRPVRKDPPPPPLPPPESNATGRRAGGSAASFWTNSRG
jgi:phage terminase small subunit